MANILIDKEKCIGCGLCEKDCSRGAIDMSGEKTEVNTLLCNKCGHCIAICPQEAVTLGHVENIQWRCEDSEEKRGSAPDPETFLDYLKFRRSIRYYKKLKIEPEKLEAVIEAGRYSPTAGNRQQNCFVILQENIEPVRQAAIKALHDAAENKGIDLGPSEVYRQSWSRMYEDYISGRCDGLFFNAPAVILVAGDEGNRYAEIDGGIAASRMEIEANALGLGVCYIGFLNTAMEFDSRIKELAGLKEGQKLTVAFVIGYPDVEYQRPVPRKPADVRRL